jgi:hypothetical protein
MSDREPSLEHQIIQLAAQRFGRRRICKQLHVGEHCVSKTLHEFHDVGVVPAPLSRRRPSKITNAILDFIDIRMLQTAHVSGAHLVHRVIKARAFGASRYRTDADRPRKRAKPWRDSTVVLRRYDLLREARFEGHRSGPQSISARKLRVACREHQHQCYSQIST